MHGKCKWDQSLPVTLESRFGAALSILNQSAIQWQLLRVCVRDSAAIFGFT